MLSRDLLGALLFLVIFTVYGVLAWQIPLLPFEEYEVVTSSTMPKIYAVLGVMFSLLSIIAIVLKEKAAQPDDPLFTKATLQQTLGLVVLMVIYAATLELLGFVVATLVFLLAGFWLMGERRFKVLVLAAVPIVLIFWLLMTQVLGIYLSAGSLWS